MNAKVPLTGNESLVLKVLSGFGFIIPNGIFVYYLLTDPAATGSALSNPISLVFIAEAFFLMGLFAWLLRRWGAQKPTALGFVVMSLIGSMAFSVPASICMISRDHQNAE